MKYVATLNGKKYEIEIERVEEYKPLDRGVTVNAPAPILAKAAAPAPAPSSTEKEALRPDTTESENESKPQQ